MNLLKRIKRRRQLLSINFVAFLSKLVNRQKLEYDVLLVKADAIGDFVLWLDAFSAFEKKYKGKKIALICNKHVQEVVENFQGISKLFIVNKHIRLSSLYRWAWRLQKYHFKEVVNPVFSRTFSMDQLIRLVNADSKIGFHGDASNMSTRDKRTCDALYTRLIADHSHSRAEQLRNADFASQVCNVEFSASLPTIPLLPQAAPNNLPRQPYCVVSLGAGSRKRCWEVNKFIELTKIIPNSIGIVLIGVGKRELHFSQTFMLNAPKEKQVYNFVNQTALPQLLHIIKNALFTIGNDSAHVHISAALRTPSVCLVGGGHWKRFLPYAQEVPELFYHPRAANKFMDCYCCDWRCKYPLQHGRWKCVDEISVENAQEVLRKLLRELSIF